MQSCVIYNPKTGDVYNIIYNMDTVPEGLEDTAMILDIPNGCNLMALDVSEEPPKPVYNYWPAIDLESVKQNVSDNKLGIQHIKDGMPLKADLDTTDLLIEEVVSIIETLSLNELGG